MSRCFIVLMLVAVSGCAAPQSWTHAWDRPGAEGRRTTAGQIASLPRVVAAPRVTPLGVRPIPPSRRHVVMPGETLSGIGQAYNIPLADLASLNNSRPPHIIYTGQEILLAELPTAPHSYRVAAGDTFLGIAYRYGLSFDQLRGRNPEVDPETLRAGQTLAVAVPAPPERRPREVTVATNRAAARADVPERSLEGFAWPVEGEVVERFGKRANGTRHDGINIRAALGSTVRAAEGGVVVYAGQSVPAMGRMLMIRHADGYLTAYGHNDMLLVETGDRVNRGQPVAKVGQSGAVSAPQLHFEIRHGADAVDPLKHLGKGGTRLASNSQP